MVTLCEEGIRLCFCGIKRECSVNCMAESEDELFGTVYLQEKELQFKEYERIEIIFQSTDITDRLYIDGIDGISYEACHIDSGGELYLSPCEEPYLLQGDQSYFALRVGIYQFRIVHNQKSFLGIYWIVPQNISKRKWNIMREDLEAEMEGLTRDTIQRKIPWKSKQMSISMIALLLITKEYNQSIRISLEDLIRRPHYRMKREYRRMSDTKYSHFDRHMLSNRLANTGKAQKPLSSVWVYDYALPENLYLLKIIREYKRKLQMCQRYIEKELDIYRHGHEDTLKQMREYEMLLKQLLAILNNFMHQEWCRKLETMPVVNVPYAMLSDMRYHLFYKLFQKIRRENQDFEWKVKDIYTWKLSSKMYELWCFFKISRFLCTEQMGFEQQNSYINQREAENPKLGRGSCFEFVKGNKRIKMYYDQYIVKEVHETDKENMPVFSKNPHRRPDIRLDLYYASQYLSSFIIEVKYRTIYSMWYAREYTCRQQIWAYKNDICSPYCIETDRNISIRKIKPVNCVWILHPTEKNRKRIDKIEEGIVLIGLCPEEREEEIIQELKKELTNAFGMQIR